MGRTSYRYALACALVAVATIGRLVFLEALGARYPLALYYPVILLAAISGGLWVGLLTTLLSMVIASYFWMEPLTHLAAGHRADWVRLATFLVSGMVISCLAEASRRCRSRADTRREHAELALADARQELERERDVLQAVMDGAINSHLVYLDRDFNFVRVNQTYAATCNYLPEEMIGKNHFALYPNGENEAIFSKVRDTGQPAHYRDKPFRFPDQPERGVTYWDWTLTPVKGPADEVTGLVYSLYETTARKRAEDELQQMNAFLEHRVQERTEELRQKDFLLMQQNRQAAMGEMINNIAHQWRQPLNGLGLQIQQLELFYEAGQFSKSILQQSVSGAMSLIKHMSSTIDDFRNFFRADKERVEFEVHTVITDAVKLVEASFNKHRIRVIIDCIDHPVIIGFPNEYAQVILNLLGNARDALIQLPNIDGCILVTVRQEHGGSVVTVSDNGGGIAEDIMAKIFDPHFTTKGPQGTGIGLFMAKTIVERNMHGSLSVTNAGNGAEFRIQV